MKPIVVLFEINPPTQAMVECAKFLLSLEENIVVFVLPIWNSTNTLNPEIKLIHANTMLTYAFSGITIPRNIMNKIHILPVFRISTSISRISITQLIDYVYQHIKLDGFEFSILSYMMQSVMQDPKASIHDWFGTARQQNVSIRILFSDQNEHWQKNMFGDIVYKSTVLDKDGLFLSQAQPFSIKDLICATPSGYKALSEILGIAAYNYWFMTLHGST